MDIKKYSGYFHDGTVIALKYDNQKLEIWMESAEILPEWVVDDALLSESRTILGKLILSEIKKILVDDVLVGELKQKYDDGEILSLNIDQNAVDLMIEWCNFPPKIRASHFEHISIQANLIYWENIPDLLKQL